MSTSNCPRTDRKLWRAITPFVVLTRGRSGSTAIVDDLDQHPNIACHQELFRLTVEWTPQDKVPSYAIMSTARQLTAADYLDTVCDATDTTSAFGFKLLTAQLEERAELHLWNFLRDHQFKFIYINRDPVAAALSSAIAKERDVYHIHRWDEPEILEKSKRAITLDTAWLTEEIKYYIFWDKQWKARLEQEKCPHLVLSYEKYAFHRNRCLEEAFSFLGVSPFKLSRPNSYLEVTSSSPWDGIRNKDEVVAALKAAGYTIKGGKYRATPRVGVAVRKILAWIQRKERAESEIPAKSLQVAKERYDRALTEYGETFGFLTQSAYVRHQLGEYAEAIPYARKAVVLNPDSWQAQFILGFCLKNTGVPAEACEVLDKVAALTPSRTEIWLAMLEALVLAGKFDEAARRYEDALPIVSDPRGLRDFWEKLFTEKIQAAVAARKFQLAKSLCDRALANYGENFGFLAQSAYVREQLGEYAEAIPYARRAVALNPDDWHVQFVLGLCLMHGVAHDEACDRLEKATTLVPTRTEIWLALLEALVLAGKFDEATRRYEEALPIVSDPRGLRAFWEKLFTEKIQAAVAARKLQLAKGLCDQALAKYGENFGFLAQSAYVRQQLGEYTEAIPFARKAVTLNPADWSAQFLLGFCLMHVGAHAEACDRLEKATTLVPIRTEIWLALLEALVLAGKFDEAARRYKEALPIVSDPAGLRNFWAENLGARTCSESDRENA